MTPERPTRGQDEFYVGYRPRMPERLAGFLRVRLVALLAGTLLLAFLLPALHRPSDPARSDFRDLRDFEGVLRAAPAPHLVVPRPGVTGERPFSRYLLVGRGKSGAKIDLAALDGRWVTVRGSLIYRDSQTLLSVRRAVPLAEPEAPVGPALAAGESLGEFTLRGEIVDSKCYMGTMRPGHSKTHRGCAVRCIAGGVPPVLLVRDAEGRDLHFLLVGPDGSSLNQRVLDHVADPVEIRGEVRRLDDLFVLMADPSGYRRLP